ncbi:MAG: hypothetical protein NC923_03160 [Candidatus Omnitrophica bacterium]|nr:hypothetical protein [Candidatus Omnitrophota bacterium]
MKKGFMVLLATVVTVCSFVFAYAASTVNVSISAQVPVSSPELAVVIKQLNTPAQDPNTGTTVTAMNFGTLTHFLADGTTDAGIWYSRNYFCVFIYTNSFGRRYQVLSTCTGLSNGAQNLPAGSFGISPGYAAQDAFNIGGTLIPQGTQPTGSVLGNPGPAIATNALIYRSETAASNRIIRAFYSLPGYGEGGALPFTGYTPIPLTQAPGTYTGTVTISIVVY